MLDELILKNQTQAVDLVICSAEYASEELPFDLEYLIVVPEVVARSCFEGAPETRGKVEECQLSGFVAGHQHTAREVLVLREFEFTAREGGFLLGLIRPSWH